MAPIRNVTSLTSVARRSFAAPTKSFSTTALRLSGKESALHNENRAEETEQHKQDMLAKAKVGKGEWKEGLASDSESAVKADRDEVEINDDVIKQLQNESKKVAGKR